jgi:hypothetical protein
VDNHGISVVRFSYSVLDVSADGYKSRYSRLRLPVAVLDAVKQKACRFSSEIAESPQILTPRMPSVAHRGVAVTNMRGCLRGP